MNFFILNVKNTSSNTPLLFFYSIIPVTDNIKEWQSHSQEWRC